MTTKTKQPTARAAKLARLKFAGYHNDSGEFTRLYLSAPSVSMEKAKEQWIAGQNAKAAGVACNCSSCAAERSQPKEKTL